MTKKGLEKNIYNSLSKEVLDLFSLFENSGYELYIVGGYIRDFCSSDEYYDGTSRKIDFLTNATYEQVKELLNGTDLYKPVKIPTSKVNTYRVAIGKVLYDISTYSKSLLEELEKRDFTMNTLYYRPKDGLFDPFNVLSICPNGSLEIIHQVETVGNPVESFKEDGLRTLRAIRLAYEKNLSIESHTADALKAAVQGGCLDNIANEKMGWELQRIFECILSSQCAKWWDVGSPTLLEEVLLKVIPNFEYNYRARLMIEECWESHSELFWWWLITQKVNNQDIVSLLNSFNVKKNIKNAIIHLNETWIGDWDNELEADDYYLVKMVLNICKTQEERDCIINEILPIFYPKCVEIREGFKKALENNEPIFMSEIAVNKSDIKTLWKKVENFFKKNKIYVLEDTLEDMFDEEEIEILLEEAQCEVWCHPEKNNKKTLLNYLWNDLLEPELEDRFLNPYELFEF